MRTKTDARRVRFPARHEDDAEALVELVFEDEEVAPCNEYIVMSHEGELPALNEYLDELGELGSLTID